jgi:hypothetical protein
MLPPRHLKDASRHVLAAIFHLRNQLPVRLDFAATNPTSPSSFVQAVLGSNDAPQSGANRVAFLAMTLEGASMVKSRQPGRASIIGHCRKS